jgi:hypothetical protein
VGGIAGGLLPDWIDTPCSLRHRAEAHSMSITGTVGYFVNSHCRPGRRIFAMKHNTTSSYVRLRRSFCHNLPLAFLSSSWVSWRDRCRASRWLCSALGIRLAHS